MALSSGSIERRVECATPKLGHAVRSLGIIYGQATTNLLANLEHELRFPRHPVWLGIADGEHERHLRIPGRAGRSDSDFVAGRAAHRIDRAADHRPRQRPHVGSARPAASLLFGGSDSEL